MLGAHFSVQNYIDSRLGLKGVWTISLADLLHRNMKDSCFQ